MAKIIKNIMEKLNPGDPVQVIWHGKLQTFTVVSDDGKILVFV